MSTDERDIDDRKNPPVAESTPPLGVNQSDAAEPTGSNSTSSGILPEPQEAEPQDAERTPTTDTLAPAPSSAESTPPAGAAEPGVKAPPNALRLHDKASNAHGVVSEFPGTIGNSPACDLALKGPGPVGVYARLRHERNAFIIEKAHSEVPLVVNEKELRSVILMDGDILMLGEHEVHIRFDRVEPDAEKEQAKNKRKSRLRVIGAIALVILLLAVVSMAWGLFSEPEALVPPIPAAETENIADNSASNGWSDQAEDRAEDATSPVVSSVPLAPPRLTPPRELQTVNPPITVEPVMSRPVVETQPPVVDTPPGSADTANTDAPSTPPARSNIAPPVSANRLAVNAAIDDAVALYVAGNGEQAIGRLQQTAGEIEEAAKKRLQATRERLDQALTAYRNGLAALNTGQPFELIRQRDRLAVAERALDTTQRSTYQRALDDAALVAYRSWAEEADNRNDTANAYRWYRHVLSIQPLDAQATRRIAALDQAAKEQYLTGYRLETKDIKSALLYWRNAASMVPRDSRWHRLASEKLNDYANFKNRG